MLGPLSWAPIRQIREDFSLFSPLFLPLSERYDFLFLSAPSLDDMRFSNVFGLSALFATTAVQVTAVQYNVTVGGAAGLMYTPEFVVSDVQRSVHNLG